MSRRFWTAVAALTICAGAATVAAESLAGWRENIAQPLALLIKQILIVIVAARVLGAVARRLRQPAVIGEIAAGIALGPSLLGSLFPEISTSIFPAASLGTLQLLSQLGVILFMFVVGLEVDWARMRGLATAAFVISQVSIAFPFALGFLAAMPLYAVHAPPGVAFQAFALFMGIALSITAFPVLARILDERGLARTPVGLMALTCAAVNDVTAWTLLTVVIAVVTSGGALLVAGITIAAVVIVVTSMFWLVRPLAARLLRTTGDDLPGEHIVVVVVTLFASALLTEAIGVHALFGAFLAGAIMPADERFRMKLRDRFETFASMFLLPLFFVFTGLRTQIGLLDSVDAWLVCLGVVLLAVIGKLGGTALAARLMGLSWNDAFVLGALMNTRGLMELIALNIGYDLGVISPRMFTILVVMALVTTVLTGPMVDAARRRRVADDGGALQDAAEA